MVVYCGSINVLQVYLSDIPVIMNILLVNMHYLPVISSFLIRFYSVVLFV